jgi:hypothetical protein
MKITDIVKNGKVDISKMKLPDGSINKEAVNLLEKSKPVVPEVSNGASLAIKVNRERIQDIPDRLPTFNIKPFPTDEHAHIGMYETKQNIYLTLAYAYNKAMGRIEKLELELNKLKNAK